MARKDPMARKAYDSARYQAKRDEIREQARRHREDPVVRERAREADQARRRASGAKPRLGWPERFWAKVDKAGPVPQHAPHLGACWVWTGAKKGRGYGHINVSSQTFRGAHRVSLELALGRELASDELALHLCDNPPCVNPGHLFAGSASDNMADMVAKGRAWNGQQAGRATA